MPALSCRSSARVAADGIALTILVDHGLVYGESSERTCATKLTGRLPKSVDVLAFSDVVLSITGLVDGRRVPEHDVVSSSLLRHLVQFSRKNSAQLGLNNVSAPYVDEDGLTKLTLTPSRSFPQTTRPHATLVSLAFTYSWKKMAPRSKENSVTFQDSGQSPLFSNAFSAQPLLPLESLLNRAHEQLFTNHVVKRYPLIFGEWCKRLDLEREFFPSIARSVLSIINRSDDKTSARRCRRTLKALKAKNADMTRVSQSSLRALVSSDTEDQDSDSNSDAAPKLTDDEVICQSMEQLFRMGVPQPRFKASGSSLSRRVVHDEGDLVETSPNLGPSLMELGDEAVDILELQDFDRLPPASSPLHHGFSFDSDHQQDWLDVYMDESPPSDSAYDPVLLNALHVEKTTHDLGAGPQDVQGDHFFVDLTMEEHVSQALGPSSHAPSLIFEGDLDQGPPDVPRSQSAEHLTSSLELDDYLLLVDEDRFTVSDTWADPLDLMGGVTPWPTYRYSSPDTLLFDIGDAFDLSGSVLEL